MQSAAKTRFSAQLVQFHSSCFKLQNGIFTALFKIKMQIIFKSTILKSGL